MFRLQPRPTLFPYTMLFRSFAFSESPANNCIPRPSNAAVGAAGPEKVPAVASIVGAAALGLDRKNTRLNSSHANLSYAVFCLKKKTEVEDRYVEQVRSSLRE